VAGSYTTHASLLARVRTGEDPVAWQEFCARYGELILGFARRAGVQPSDADDVLQDVLTILTRSMRDFVYDPAKGKFRSYLKTLVVRTIFRKSRRKRTAASLDAIELDPVDQEHDAAVDKLWELEWRQYHVRMAMRVVVSEFNSTDLEAFEQYGVQGRSATETAEALQLSLDQVYQAKSRILKRMSSIIADQVREEG
jgi:RNA polymerase sigma factor (sigma-70 family)